MDRLEAAKYIKDHCLGSEVYRDGTTWNDAMVTAVEVLEGKGTNVPTNSALDHIHNVVKEDAAFIEWLREKETSMRSRRTFGSITIADVIDALIKDYLAQKGGNKNGQE